MEPLPITLFEELGNVLQRLHIGDDVSQIQLKSFASQQILSYYKEDQCITKAFFLACKNHETRLGNLFFGSIKPNYDAQEQKLTGSDSGRNLQVVVCFSIEPLQKLPAYTPNTVIVYTDFKTFILQRTDNEGKASKPFTTLTAREMCEEIRFTGSVWASVYFTHYAIICRTISYTFTQDTNGALFSTKFSAANNRLDEERDARNRLGCFNSFFTDFLDLEALRVKMQSCSRPPRLLSEHKEGIYTLRQYSPQRSSLLDFGEPAGELTRGDFVTTYNIENEEFHREFFISPRKWEAYESELQLAAFDILHMLAIRRTKLFRIGFASRVYNVLLPPVLLVGNSKTCNSYALFPCLNLYRNSKRGDFRRTLSITFIVCPVRAAFDQGILTGISSRPAPLEELLQLKDDLLLQIADPATLKITQRYTITGPIKTNIELPDECAIPELTQYIAKAVLKRILVKGYSYDPAIEPLINSTSFTSNLESQLATMLLQVEWSSPKGFNQPWERWLATGNDKIFHDILFRTLFYKDYLNPDLPDASSRAVQMEKFNIGNTLGADMAGMTLYNPQETLKVVLYPKTYERYPNHSIVRWMAWQVYIDSALASLRALIYYKFHPILEERGDLHSIIGTLDEMIQEFVDFYDLDIKDYFYRKEYEKLRALLQIDSDYAQLLSRFATTKEDESLREQRLINKLIVSLTLATVTITVVSTLAQMGTWDVSNYIAIALVLSTVFVWLGYILFDPFRRSYKRLHHALKKIWRLTQ